MKKITLLLLLLVAYFSHGQVESYTFTQSTGSYTEINGGQLLGSETSDEQRFLDTGYPEGSSIFTGDGLPIGFDFIYNGLVYNRFGVHTNGWISLGSSNFTPGVNITSGSTSLPLSSSTSNVPDFFLSRISALGKNLQAQVGATLRYETIGIAPNRTLVIQWKNYKKQGSSGTFDVFNFQIRLNETSNTIVFMYNDFMSTATSGATYQVGLRGASVNLTSNYVNRTSTSSWSETTAGTLATSSITMNDVIKPSNGLTYTWTPPVCSAPTADFSVTNLSNNSVSLSWNTSLSNPINYEYVVSTSSDLPMGSGTVSPSSSATVSDLLPNTNYFVFLRSICDTSTSVWVLAGSFKTQCDPVTSFYENFDAYATGSGLLPNCWSRGGSGGSTASISAGSVVPASAPNRLSFSTVGGASPTETYVILPAVSNLQANTHRLRFKAYSSVAGRSMAVGYLTDPADIGTFVQMESWLLPATPQNAQEFLVIPTGIPAGVKNLAFKNSGIDVTSITYVYVDDVNWELNSSCLVPTTLMVSEINSNDVNLSWYSGGNEEGWEIQYGAPNFTLGTGTVVSGITNLNTVLDELEANTTYQVYLRAICADNLPSSWTNSITFKTKCESVDEFQENFDTTPTSTLPSCWSKAGTSTSVSVASSSFAPNSPPNRLMISASGSVSSPTVAYAILPDVSNLQNNSHRLTFRAYATASNRVIHVGYFTDMTELQTYQNIQTITLPSFLSSSALEFTIDPMNIPEGVKNLVFKNDGAVNATNIVYIDDVSWTQKSLCSDLTNLIYENVTSTTAAITWYTDGAETSWQYVYSDNANSDPNTLVPIDVSDNTAATLTNLVPSTNYTVWVRSKCNANVYGEWSTPIAFLTNCAASTEFFQNFNSSSVLPDCWRKVGSGGNAFILTSGLAPNNQNVLSLVSTALSDVTVALPPISNASSGTHQLKFKVRSGSGTTFGTVEVGYLDNTTTPASFVTIQPFTVTSSTTYDSYIVMVGTDVMSENLAFRLTNSLASNVLIDDVIWEPIPVTIPNCAVISASTSTSCGNYENVLTWLPVLGSTGYNLTMGTTPNGTDILNSQDMGTSLSYAFSGVSSSTYYYSLKPYNSFGSATGCEEQSFTTIASSCYCIAMPNSNDGSGITNVLLGTTNFTNADVYYFDNSASSVSLTKGLEANLQITFATGTHDYHTNIWVDYNDNFEFEANELVFYGVSGTTSPSVLNASFLIPIEATLGNHRMRIVATDVLQTPANACYNGSYGVVLDFTLAVEENLTNEMFDASFLKVYPNPVNDMLNISNNQIVREATLINLLGQSVMVYKMNAEKGEMNLSTLSSGTYLLKLTTDNEIKLIKIIKN